MSDVKEAAEVEVDADELWSAVGSFGSVAGWHPHLSGMTVARERTGLVRTATFKTGGQEVERLNGHDDAHHIYRYSVARTSMPVRDYSALASRGKLKGWSLESPMQTKRHVRAPPTSRSGTRHLRAPGTKPPRISRGTSSATGN